MQQLDQDVAQVFSLEGILGEFDLDPPKGPNDHDTRTSTSSSTGSDSGWVLDQDVNSLNMCDAPPTNAELDSLFDQLFENADGSDMHPGEMLQAPIGSLASQGGPGQESMQMTREGQQQVRMIIA